MLCFPLSELQKRLDPYGYSLRSVDGDDDLIQVVDIRNIPCGILHHNSLLRWLCQMENWRRRFPDTPLSPQNQIPLRLTLDILSTHALNESDTIAAMADCDGYTPGKLLHLRQLLSSVIYGLAFRLTERRFSSGNPEIPGGLWPVIDGLHRLADNIYEEHCKQRPVERVALDSIAMSLTRIHLRLDEWLLQPDRTMRDEPVMRPLFAVSRAMKSLLLDIARIRGGNWSA